MAQPVTRYARDGDVHIAFQVVGDGPRDLLLVSSWLTQIEHLWAYPRFARMLERLAAFSRLIMFDRRGSGMSERGPPAPLEEQMDDVQAVLDAAGSKEVTLLSETEGSALACLFAA